MPKKAEISKFEVYHNKGRYILARNITVFFIGVFCLLSLITLPIDFLIFSFYFTVFIISILTLIVLKKTKNHEFVFWSFALTASILVTISFYFIDYNLHYSDFFWIICIILFAYIGLGRVKSLIFFFYHALNIGFYIFYQTNIIIDNLEEYPTQQLIITFIELLFALSVMVYLISKNLEFQEYAHSSLKDNNKILQDQNEVIKKQSKENETLVKEIHHRVKNNLQIVISLLRIQIDELKTREAKEQFNEAINRIMSISLIHQKLYQEKELAHVKLDSYVQELFKDITYYSSIKKDIGLEFKSELEKIGLKTIIPLGLLLNELITNSFKHAFSNKNKGSIKIDVLNGYKENEIVLIYKDNGTWIEANENGFGMELLEVLSQQLEGEMQRKGSAYKFTIQNLDH